MAVRNAITLQGGTSSQLADVDSLDVGTGISSTSGTVTISGSVLFPGEVLLSDNHLYLNHDYTTAVGQTGGLVVNYLPTATATTVNGVYTPGVPATSNPTVVTAGSATFAAGDFIQISGSTKNNGLFEVLSHVGTTLTVRGVGLTACVEDFTQNQFAASSTDGAAITKVGISIARAGSDGAWETGSSSSTPVTFLDLAAKSVVTTFTPLADGGTYAVPGRDSVVLVVTSTYTSIVTLPAGFSGRTVVVKDASFNSGAKNITVNPTSGLIDGSASFTIALNAQSVTFISDGTNWFIC